MDGAAGKRLKAETAARRARRVNKVRDDKELSQVRGIRLPAANWPIWPAPSDEDMLKLARATTPYIRFLNLGVVQAVTEDNHRMSADWSSRLEALGIDPAIYLWEGSPCVFPGIRRHAGKKETAMFQQRAASNDAAPQCLALDHNDYPKQLWAFVFTGKRFQKRGPDGYQLAHILDHKEYGNRWRMELDIPSGSREPKPYGLFTSAANLAYVPDTFMGPTDFSQSLRSLIQRRARQLYGEVCRIVPPPLAIKACEDPNWSLDNFKWDSPVGDTVNVADFLEFRRKQMERLFEKRSRQK